MFFIKIDLYYKTPPSQHPSKAANEEGVLHCSKKVSKHLDGISMFVYKAI